MNREDGSAQTRETDIRSGSGHCRFPLAIVVVVVIKWSS